MPTFEKKLEQWFKRKVVPIWVTEYGFETKPGEPKGVTLAQQAAYAKQALAYVRDDPNVDMFIWFIFRDDPTSTWQSGLENQDNSRKPAFATFTEPGPERSTSGARSNTSSPARRIPCSGFRSGSSPLATVSERSSARQCP